MSVWEKINIVTDTGETRTAQAPVIISASRSTDIPAFYADWFFERLRKGYVAWRNPFNGKLLYVSFDRTRLIVFWSKNPRPLLPHLTLLKEKGIHCYVQFTLNNYENENLEPRVPALASRIETFKLLVEQLGPGSVIWRFDPLILSDSIDVDLLLKKASYIGDHLQGFTEKLVFSYANIATYRRVKSNLTKLANHLREFSLDEKLRWAKELARLNKRWGYQLATCAEDIDLEKYGIGHNKCIDDDLMVRLFCEDSELMNFIGAKPFFGKWEMGKGQKDPGQRKMCGCIVSKDIGEYNTCPHLCEYCYANSSKSVALKHWVAHRREARSERIVPDG